MSASSLNLLALDVWFRAEAVLSTSLGSLRQPKHVFIEVALVSLLNSEKRQEPERSEKIFRLAVTVDTASKGARLYVVRTAVKVQDDDSMTTSERFASLATACFFFLASRHYHCHFLSVPFHFRRSSSTTTSSPRPRSTPTSPSAAALHACRHSLRVGLAKTINL